MKNCVPLELKGFSKEKSVYLFILYKFKITDKAYLLLSPILEKFVWRFFEDFFFEKCWNNFVISYNFRLWLYIMWFVFVCDYTFWLVKLNSMIMQIMCLIRFDSSGKFQGSMAHLLGFIGIKACVLLFHSYYSWWSLSWLLLIS